jgi:membrane protein required for colicin V production
VTTLDIVLLAVLLIFIIADTFLGFINVAVALGGLFLGVLVAGLVNDPLSNLITFTSDKNVAKGVAFVLVVLLFGIAAHLISFLLGLIPFFGLVNHALGAALGLVQGLLVCGVILVGAVLINPTWTQDQVQQSVVAKALVKPLSDGALMFAPVPLKDVVQSVVTKF